LIPEAWAQALTMLDDYGLEGVGSAVIDGMRSVPPGRVDVMRQWEAVAEKLYVIAKASSTLH
jgi:hypothetical protein